MKNKIIYYQINDSDLHFRATVYVSLEMHRHPEWLQSRRSCMQMMFKPDLFMSGENPLLMQTPYSDQKNTQVDITPCFSFPLLSLPVLSLCTLLKQHLSPGLTEHDIRNQVQKPTLTVTLYTPFIGIKRSCSVHQRGVFCFYQL